MTDTAFEDFWANLMSLAFKDNGSPEMIFRGVTDESFKLIPSIGRDTAKNTLGDISTLESKMLQEFKRLTVPLLRTPPETDFEWLFLAQHYGLPTRLLDWSSNPLVALFFASETTDDKDGAFLHLRHMVTDQYELFNYRTADYTAEQKAKRNSIFKIQPHQGHIIFLRPRYSDERYLNQRSVFSCPADPFSEPTLVGIGKIIIPGRWKPEIRRRLRALGVSTSFIYPGLAGVAGEIRSHHFQPVTSDRMIILTARMEVPAD
ncbi:FRG domain-containing protein [Luteibacter sp. 9133]|uniref:FRG domain-containing protein n=1 Tax=Luteibacter sp. 9133 TaxID=1500891 RepID=UPI001EFA49FF|nr:FRG domain-containing protein [Luteibacter sp. 9133]